MPTPFKGAIFDVARADDDDLLVAAGADIVVDQVDVAELAGDRLARLKG